MTRSVVTRAARPAPSIGVRSRSASDARGEPALGVRSRSASDARGEPASGGLRRGATRLSSTCPSPQFEGRQGEQRQRERDDPEAYDDLRLRPARERSEEHTSELQSHSDLVCRLLLEKKKK